MLITNKKLKGFTLLELIVVIAIIAILAVIAIPSFNKAINEAKSTSIKANMKLAMQEIMKEQINNGGVVPGLQGCDDNINGYVYFRNYNFPSLSSYNITVQNIIYTMKFITIDAHSDNSNLCVSGLNHPYRINSFYTSNSAIYSQKYLDIIGNIAKGKNFLEDTTSFKYVFYISYSGKDKFANYIYLPNYKVLCVDNQGQTKEYEILNKTNFNILNNTGIKDFSSNWWSTGVCP